LDLASRQPLELGTKFRGNARNLSGLQRAIYNCVCPRAGHFIGDRQQSHGKNAHKKVVEFAESSTSVLDVGSGDRRLLPHVVTVDIDSAENVDFQADAQRLPFPDGSWKRVILQNVLEHVADPPRVVAELARVLADDGLLYVEVPFLYPVHDRFDYRRWTISGLCAELAPLQPVDQGIAMGVWSALSVTTRAALTHRIRNVYLAAAVDIVAGWLMWPLQYLDDVVRVTGETQICAGSIFVVAAKRGEVAVS
jgi:SAM-dependent methyltransferase